VGDLVRDVVSIGGLSVALLAGFIWAVVRPRSSHPRRFIVSVVLLYSIASLYPASRAAAKLFSRPYRPLEARDVPAGRSAVVILGSGSFTARDWAENAIAMNDPVAAERVIEAVRVCKMIDPEVVVSSGGSVGRMDRNAPGGAMMKELLIRLGVPASKIQVENDSQTTHDEAVIVKRLLAPMKIQHIVLVTSDIHMRRSVGTFRAEGLDVIPAIARSQAFASSWDTTFLPSTAGMNETQDLVHELLGVGYYWVRGWYR
jgi:uncharacterized SAM-binding protein YcdF (DUF218 family)